MVRRDFLLFSLAALPGIATAGCALVPPKLEVLKANLRVDVVNTDGEADWAYVLDVSVRNTGARGRVRAKARVTTAAGEQLCRDSIVKLDRDESRDLRFVFPEPSLIGDLVALMLKKDAAGATYEFSHEVVG